MPIINRLMADDLRNLKIKGPGGLRDVAGQLNIKNRSNLNGQELIEQIMRARRGRRQTEASRMKRQGQEAIRQAQRQEQGVTRSRPHSRPQRPRPQAVTGLQGRNMRGPGSLVEGAKKLFIPKRWTMRKQELIVAIEKVSKALKKEGPIIDRYGLAGNLNTEWYVPLQTPLKLRQWMLKLKEEYEELRLEYEDLPLGREKSDLKKKLDKKKKKLAFWFGRQEEEEREIEYEVKEAFNGARKNFLAKAPSEPAMDIERFFENAKERLLEELNKMAKPFKVNMVLVCEYEKREANDYKVIEDFHHIREIKEVFPGTNLAEYLEQSKEVLKELSESHTESGSGWMLRRVQFLVLRMTKFKPIRGGTYKPLPKFVQVRKAVVNMKNKDDECFKWSITRAMFPRKRDQERIDKTLKKNSEKLNWKGIVFPVDVKKAPKIFEKNNPDVSLCIVGYDQKDRFYPINSSREDGKKKVIDLLLFEGHFCWIKDLSRLLGKQYSKKKTKRVICRCCFNHYTKRGHLEHEVYCHQNEPCVPKMPKKGQNQRLLEAARECTIYKDTKITFNYESFVTFETYVRFARKMKSVATKGQQRA